MTDTYDCDLLLQLAHIEGIANTYGLGFRLGLRLGSEATRWAYTLLFA